MTQGQFMNKTILFNTEMFEALLNGKKTVFVIPIESKKIKDETFASYFHSEFTTFDTSYHTRFSLSHPFKIGDKIKIHDKDFPIDGEIEDIKAFYIILKSSDGEMITYPNNLLMQKGISVLKNNSEEREFFD